MPNILVWNIERFGINKLRPNKKYDITAQRRMLIQTTISQTNPDIIIIIEIQTQQLGFGRLIDGGSGRPAVLSLLAYLNDTGTQWHLVPPLITSMGTGYSEAVAVFFTARYNFWGPWLWNGQTAVAPGGGPAVAYGNEWAICLPAVNSTKPNLALPQNYLAGQPSFFYAGGGPLIRFPTNDSRSLWLTQFKDTVTNRILNLFTVHFPPNVRLAPQAFVTLPFVPEIRAPLAPNEDRLILGDFNLSANDNNVINNVFRRLTDADPNIRFTPQRYTQLVPPSPNHNHTTLISSIRQATLAGAAPLYRYGQRDSTGQYFIVDNAFVAREGVTAAASARIINRVIGQGAASPMINTIPQILALHPGAPRARKFQNLFNYGQIRATSDHLPILVDLP